MNLDNEYRLLISIVDLNRYSKEKALNFLGRLIDISLDLRRPEGLQRAIGLADGFSIDFLSPQELALFHYCIANAWANLRHILRENKEESWHWEQEELEKEIYNLRKALQIAMQHQIPKERLCQIYTNLGNNLSHVGRFIEALSYWDKALLIDPSFGMARGNRGVGIRHYACQLYDPWLIKFFFNQSVLELRESLSQPLDIGAREEIEKYVKWIEPFLSPDFIAHQDNSTTFCLGQTEEEIHYRKWCLKNRLFINPLNDLGPYPMAANDVLTIHSIMAKVGEGPSYHGFFNQMKQEYVSARYLFYEGLETGRPHFSDKDVYLLNTLDYPSYSLSTEKIRIAFRVMYSLFDKIAYFVNHYMQLTIKERRIHFRTCWYLEQNKEKGLRIDFQCRKNWPLRGLFWLSKDLYENRAGFMECIEPEARRLYDIRNYIEHRYFKIHDDPWMDPSLTNGDDLGWPSDKLALSKQRKDFEDMTLKITKMARAGLIYLALAIHDEEHEKAEKEGKNDLPCFHLEKWEDGWKY